jgi:hypothetical protein
MVQPPKKERKNKKDFSEKRTEFHKKIGLKSPNNLDFFLLLDSMHPAGPTAYSRRLFDHLGK